MAARLVALALWAVWFGSPAYGSSSYDFTYEGRITDKAGKPFQGTFALQIDFFHDEQGGDPVLTVTDGLDAVPLSAGGMFQVTVSLTNDEFAKVFPDVSQTVYVAFTDLSHSASQPLPRQRVMMLPYAGKVPVDGKTVRFGADGRLTVGPGTRPKSGEFLTMDANGQFAWAVPWTTVGTSAGGGGSFNVDLASGRVGIGTTSQLAKLAVTGSTYVNADNAAIVADSGASRLGFVKKYGSAPVLASGSSTDITFATSNVANLLDSSIGDQTLTPRMTVKSNGNVGIGTTNPLATLHVLASGGKNVFLGGGSTTGAEIKLISTGTSHFSIYNSGNNNLTFANTSVLEAPNNAGTALVSISSGGNVGIGTGEPVARLHVAGSIHGADGLAIYQQSNNTHTIQTYIDGHWTDRTTYANGCCSPLLLQPDVGNVGIGTTWPTAKLQVSGDFTGTWAGDSAQFIVSGATDPTKRMGVMMDTTNNVGTIQAQKSGYGAYNLALNPAGGNVGIGTTSPAHTLQVGSGASDVQPVAMRGYSVGTYWKGGAAFGFSSASVIMGELNGVAQIAGHDGSLNNWSNLAINSGGGNVGIGTTTPGAKLDVAGVVRYGAGSSKGQLSYGASGLITLESVSANTSIALLPTGTGKVGIGTTSPTHTLQVGSGASDVQPVAMRGYSVGTSWKGGAAFGFSSASVIMGELNGVAQIAGHDGSLNNWSNLAINSGGGNVGIGTTSPTEKLHVAGNLRVQGSTDCILGGGSGATNCTSDLRLKDNVVPIAESLDKISKLRGVEFDWNDLALSPGTHSIGVIAQDVEKVFPTAVITSPDTGYKMVDYAVLVAPIIEAVKTLSAENAAIKAENKQIKAENQALMDNTLEINQKLNELMQSVCQMDGRFDFCGR